jgi:protein-tyrosine phosphatase
MAADNGTIAQPSVLFVCLGNICRSPLAEAAFRLEMARVGHEIGVDSAGTGNYHAGCAPDPRAQAVARRHGTDIADYRARQVTSQDFRRFTHIIALDRRNLADLERVRPYDGTAKLNLLLDFLEGREGEAVADPYFGDEAGFEVTWTEVSQAVAGLVRHLVLQHDSVTEPRL